MVEVEGHFPREAICVRLLNHLQKHCESISRTPHVTQNRTTVTPAEHIVPLQNAHEAVRNNIQLKVTEYPVAKNEPEQNNNNSSFNVRSNNHTQSSESDYEKHPETNGVSYKYKTNIKLRFTQDINGGSQENPKRQKIENGRRNSVASTENQR